MRRVFFVAGVLTFSLLVLPGAVALSAPLSSQSLDPLAPITSYEGAVTAVDGRSISIRQLRMCTSAPATAPPARVTSWTHAASRRA